MDKKINNDEVDLLELVFTIWNKKKVVLFFTIIAILIGFIYKSLNTYKSVYEIRAQINPITVSEDVRYKIYSAYIDSIKPLNLDEGKFNSTSIYSEDHKRESDSNILITNIPSKLKPPSIDKVFLFDLFIDKIRQRKNLDNYIKQSKLIEADHNNNEDLKKAFEKLASLRSENKNPNSFIGPINVKFDTYDVKKSKEFLKIIEKEANIEIKKNIHTMFDNYLKYAETMANFQLEDIDSQLLIVSDENEIQLLKEKRKLLISDKYIKRLKNAFEQSPLSSSSDFYAANILYELSNSKNSASMQKILIIFGVIGLIIGVIIALMAKAIELRKVNKVN